MHINSNNYDYKQIRARNDSISKHVMQVCKGASTSKKSQGREASGYSEASNSSGNFACVLRLRNTKFPKHISHHYLGFFGIKPWIFEIHWTYYGLTILEVHFILLAYNFHTHNICKCDTKYNEVLLSTLQIHIYFNYQIYTYLYKSIVTLFLFLSGPVESR